jgi:hypothetical protein
VIGATAQAKDSVVQHCPWYLTFDFENDSYQKIPFGTNERNLDFIDKGYSLVKSANQK